MKFCTKHCGYCTNHSIGMNINYYLRRLTGWPLVTGMRHVYSEVGTEVLNTIHMKCNSSGVKFVSYFMN